ncbi:MAG: hypothetical protein JWQ16_2454 [Novosphingobium sp.]|nr:hypothetical protein [Novosphingobium sp.]
MSTFLVVLLVAGSANAAAVPVTTGRLAPLQTCDRLPGAATFRAALASAVHGRNPAALAALAAPTIRLDFGDGGGAAELHRRLAGADGAKLWRELDRILPLGCAVQDGNLVLPSLFAHDFGDADPFGIMLVTGARVPLLAGPNPAALPLRLLSWTMVTPISGDDSAKPFRRVRLGRQTGYVEATKLRSPVDYRLLVSRTRGAWKIDAFVAGD